MLDENFEQVLTQANIFQPTFSKITQHSVQTRPTCCMLDDVGLTCWLHLNKPLNQSERQILTHCM